MAQQQSPPRLLHVVASFSPAAAGTTEGIRKLAQSSSGAVELVCLDDPGEFIPYRSLARVEDAIAKKTAIPPAHL
jgi:hypothetical protein